MPAREIVKGESAYEATLRDVTALCVRALQMFPKTGKRELRLSQVKIVLQEVRKHGC